MVVGLCGYKGSGKSEVAKYIAENYRFKRVNFKDALVEEMKERLPNTLQAIVDDINQFYPDLMGINDFTIDGLFRYKPPIMRALMQEYGTEVRRADNENYWADQWTTKVKELKGNIVTDDVRFFNELSALIELNGVLIRVVRDDITSGGEHQSEKEQEKFIEDFTIVAKKGDLAGVYKQVDQIIATIKAD